MHKVLLVNRTFGAGQQQYPVCGISGKVYGQASYNSTHKGVAFEMSDKEYAAAAFDIVGNISNIAGQVWVPVVLEVEADPLQKVDMKVLHARAKAGGFKSVGLSRDAIIAKLSALDPSKPKPRCDARGCGDNATQKACEFHFCDAHAPNDAEDLPNREPRKEIDDTSTTSTTGSGITSTTSSGITSDGSTSNTVTNGDSGTPT